MTVSGRKEQFMALVERDQLADLDALRVVAWTSRAEINRRALADWLPKAKRAERAGLERLTAVSARAGQSTSDFVAALVADRQRVPSLDELEKMSDEQLRALLKP